MEGRGIEMEDCGGGCIPGRQEEVDVADVDADEGGMVGGPPGMKGCGGNGDWEITG